MFWQDLTKIISWEGGPGLSQAGKCGVFAGVEEEGLKYVSRVNPFGEERGGGVSTITWLCAFKDPGKAEINRGRCLHDI